jgi:hypothetical protein
MSFLEVIFNKFLYLAEKITDIFFLSTFNLIKSFVFIVSLGITFFLIYFWIKLEIKNRDEYRYWNYIFKSSRDYFFMKKQKKIFNQIKEIFYKDNLQGIFEIHDFFDLVLSVFGYQGSFEEKIKTVDEKVLPNKEEIKKAFQIISLIKNKIQNNESINLSADDFLMIFKTYEEALLYLRVLNSEDLLAKNQE